jgi:hypothetical protein
MDNLCLSKIQIYITTRCNLKCKLCGTYCPYLKNPHDLNYDVFKKDVMRLFELVDKFERLELTGGEPILNPYLPDMVDFLRGYGNRVDEIRLLSNGRSLPSDKLLKAIQNIVDDGNRFFVLVDNYGLELSLCIEDAGRLYKNTGAKVELRDYHSERMYMNGWFDYGISPELKRTREQIMQEPKCTNFPLQNRSLFEGTIYTCGRGMYYHTEIAPTPPPPMQFPNYVLIHDDSKTKEQLRDELREFWHGEYFEACGYCTCRFPQDTRRFPPAEQLD